MNTDQWVTGTVFMVFGTLLVALAAAMRYTNLISDSSGDGLSKGLLYFGLVCILPIGVPLLAVGLTHKEAKKPVPSESRIECFGVTNVVRKTELKQVNPGASKSYFGASIGISDDGMVLVTPLGAKTVGDTIMGGTQHIRTYLLDVDKKEYDLLETIDLSIYLDHFVLSKALAVNADGTLVMGMAELEDRATTASVQRLRVIGIPLDPVTHKLTGTPFVYDDITNYLNTYPYLANKMTFDVTDNYFLCAVTPNTASTTMPTNSNSSHVLFIQNDGSTLGQLFPSHISDPNMFPEDALEPYTIGTNFLQVTPYDLIFDINETGDILMFQREFITDDWWVTNESFLVNVSRGNGRDSFARISPLKYSPVISHSNTGFNDMLMTIPTATISGTTNAGTVAFFKRESTHVITTPVTTQPPSISRPFTNIPYSISAERGTRYANQADYIHWRHVAVTQPADHLGGDSYVHIVEFDTGKTIFSYKMDFDMMAPTGSLDSIKTMTSHMFSDKFTLLIVPDINKLHVLEYNCL